MPLPLRGRRRLTVVALVVVCAVIYLTSGDEPFTGQLLNLGQTGDFVIHSSLHRWQTSSSESARLERLMNDPGRSADRVQPRKSTFDWGSVQYEVPPPASQNVKKLLVSGEKHTQRPRIQHDFPPESAASRRKRETRRAEVRTEFERAWESYRSRVWRKDMLLPITGRYADQLSGWGATLVDSMDTLWIMGFRDHFDEAVAAVAELDFGRSTSDRVNTFETNIRYLGGLLAAYDLSGRSAILAKAVELGDFLYGAFNTKNRMPVDFIDFEKAKTGEALEVEGIVVSASPGTISLELTRLSQITGDPKYYNAASRVMELFFRGQNKTRLPGMWPTYVSMSWEDVVTGDSFTLGAGADSLYEYLPKMVAILPNRSQSMYERMSKAFMRAAEKHLIFRPMLPGREDVLLAGNVNIGISGKPILDPETEHLTCFIGGVFALAGRLFQRPEDVTTGAKLTRGCVHAYASMPSGMGPERWNTVPCPHHPAEAEPQQKQKQPCPWSEEAWEAEKARRPEWREYLPRGYVTAKDPRYILRPEAIESVFVLYRITGDPWYQDVAWDMFASIRNGTRTEYANAAVRDVTRAPGELEQEDYMESFWLAETLKYFYLVFSPPDLISLDYFVLNTEAHPFNRLPRNPR